MKKLYQIAVRGKTKEWLFDFKGDPRYLQEWLDDGLDIAEVLSIVPTWIVDIGLTKLWCRIQDIFGIFDVGGDAFEGMKKGKSG